MNCQIFCFSGHNCLLIVVNLVVAVVAMLSSFSCLIDAQTFLPQRFAIEPSDKTAIVGDTVILPCRVVNKVGTLQWTRDGFGLGTDRVLNGFPRYTMIGTDDEGDYSLQISSVSLEDDATFQCQVGASEGIRGIRSRSAQFSVFLPPEPPVIVQARAQGDYLRTTAGIAIELTCEAHAGKPPAELTWLDGDGNPVSKGVTYTTYQLSDGKRWNAALKWSFTASKEFDGKTLTCRSENSALKIPAKTSIRIEVKYAPEVELRVLSPAGQTMIQAGDDVEFACNASGNPRQMLYKWFHNDEPVLGDHTSRLTLKKVFREMNGAVISCEVSNSVGTTRARHTLSIAYGPSFRSPIESVYGAEPGQDVRLRCDVDGNPRPEITWMRLGSSVVLNHGPEIVVKNMSQPKAGKYVCRASIKGFDEISTQMLLFLKSPPRIRRPYVQYGVEGEAVKVECLIDSIPPPTKILWHHNAQTVDVDNNQSYEIVEEPVAGESTLRSMIVIRKSKTSDFGAYNCSVWNMYGFDSRIITLVQESNFSPLVLIIGIVIVGIVFVIVSAIVIILCTKRKPPLDSDSYQSDFKKGQSSGQSGPTHHHHHHQPSTTDSDSDIKVEIRTASSLSQRWNNMNEGSSDNTNEGSSDRTVNTETLNSIRDHTDHQFAKVVENIYSYTNQSEPVFPPSSDLHLTNNGYIPYYNSEYLQPSSMPSMINNNNNHNLGVDIDDRRQSQSPQPQTIIVPSVAVPSDHPAYGTIIDSRYGRIGQPYGNPYMRTSLSLQSSLMNGAQQTQQQPISVGMYSANNQKYITSLNCNNSHGSRSGGGQLATHV